jgi:putative two-component system response regulator
MRIMEEEDGRQFDPALMAAFRKAFPEIHRIMDVYADDKGVLTDLELMGVMK